MLCECQRLEGCLEHRDMHSSYILWVLHHDKSHVVFLHKNLLNALEYTDGQTFLQLLEGRTPEECCKMISRTLLGALKYKPDYIVIVSDTDSGAPWASGLSMDTVLGLAQPELLCIRALAEGSAGGNNLLGRRLSELCGVLADRGFFNDLRNRRYCSKVVT